MRNYLKCSCRHCDEHIEFPPELLGAEVNCPHCGETTILYDPAPPTLPIPPQPWRKPASKTIWIIGATGVVFLALAAVFLLLSNTKTPQQRIEADLKVHL